MKRRTYLSGALLIAVALVIAFFVASRGAGPTTSAVPPASPILPVTETTLNPDLVIERPSSGGFAVFASTAPQQLDPAYQAREADVIVLGTVLEVSPARWNSPDGREWSGSTDEDMPIVYTGFLVKPTEVLKGEPAWGSPVAFRTLGGVFGESAGSGPNMGEFADVRVGDEIIIMGVDRPFYGGSYDRPAYWSLVNATSVYRNDSTGVFRRLNAQEGRRDTQDELTLNEARGLVATER